MPLASRFLPFLLSVQSCVKEEWIMTFRVLGPHERGRFAPEAWGHLLGLDWLGRAERGRARAHHRTCTLADRRPHRARRPPFPHGRGGVRRTGRWRPNPDGTLSEWQRRKRPLGSESARLGAGRRARRVGEERRPRRRRRPRRTRAAVAATPVVDVLDEADIGAPAGTSTLVIVESPAKAKTIGKYLGRGYRVRATVGHIMDLPEKKLGIDVENGFTPDLVPIPGKEKTIAELEERGEGQQGSPDRDRS